jgi:hypothetical protein
MEKDDEERRRFMMTLRMPQQYIPGMHNLQEIIISGSVVVSSHESQNWELEETSTTIPL